jgi:hypothetical protein
VDAAVYRLTELIPEDVDTSFILDDKVHDEKSKEASLINNDGIESQIEYLLSRGHTENEIRDIIIKHVKGETNGY